MFLYKMEVYFLSNVITDTIFLSVAPMLPPILPMRNPPIIVNAMIISIAIDADMSALPSRLLNCGM